MNNGESQDAFDFAHYWIVVKRGKWTILLCTLIFLVLGAYAASKMTPMYQATAKILAEPQKPNATRDERYMAGALVFLFYETQYEIIKSRRIAETVVDKLGLVEKYKADQREGKLNTPSGIADSLKKLISSSDEEAEAEAEALPNTDDGIRQRLAMNIQENLQVTGGKTSQIINISYRSSNPEETASIINALSDAYIAFGLAARQREAKDTQDWLSAQSEELKKKLLDSENRLKEFRVAQGLVGSDQQERVANTQISSLNSELIRAQTEFSVASELYRQIKNVKPGSEESYSLGPVLQNQTASALVNAQARLSQRVAELSERYGSKHPRLIGAQSELQSAERTLNREIAKIISNIEKDYRLAKTQVQNINRLISQNKNQIQSLQGASLTHTSLEREVENNRRMYESFLAQLTNAKVSGEFEGSNIKIVDRATVPEQPYKPNVKLTVLMATMIGAFIGLVLSFIRDAMNNTFRTPEMLEEKLSVPNLGITPASKVSKNMPAPELQYLTDSRSVFAESVNSIRTGLLFSNIDNPPQTLLVTSSFGSEGKSTLSLNLAASFSQLGKTLLLEVDLRKPSLAKNVAATNAKGLSDILAGEITVINGIHFENDGQLGMISCGTLPYDPMELLSSHKFAKLLESLKENFEYIILDGPPILPVSDAGILGNKVDGVVLAVKAEDTRIKAVKRSVSILRKLNVNILGAVLTVAELKKMNHYGDHYYAGEYYSTGA